MDVIIFLDFWTKVFFINMILLYSATWIDTNLLDSWIEDDIGLVNELCSVWSLLSLISIPVWCIYKILTW